MKNPRTIACALLVMACCTRLAIDIATGCYFGLSTRLKADIMSLTKATILSDQENDAPPLDPWGNEYRLEVDASGEKFRVGTYGKDGVPGGKGDDEDVFGKWRARK